MKKDRSRIRMLFLRLRSPRHITNLTKNLYRLVSKHLSRRLWYSLQGCFEVFIGHIAAYVRGCSCHLHPLHKSKLNGRKLNVELLLSALLSFPANKFYHVSDNRWPTTSR